MFIGKAVLQTGFQGKEQCGSGKAIAAMPPSFKSGDDSIWARLHF